MQQPETHTIGDGGNGGGGKIFGGGGGGGERRLRLHHHQGQALKCPRCDSTNTKFCYYNNYNFSQPRHFCKGCRRYWTKGGILRNVPVGGGCRKPKRSRPKKPSSADAGPELESESPRPKKPSCRSSSSESSSLTAPPPDPSSKLLESGFFLPHSAPKPTPNLEPEAEMFAGSFSSLITDPAILGYTQEQSVRSDPSWHLQKPTSGAVVVDQELKVNEITGCLLDQPVQVEFPMVQNRSGTTGLWPPLDWHSVEEQSFCDLYGAVDQAYWSQNQWSTTDHHDHPLYLP